MEQIILSLTTIPQRLNYHNESGGLKPVIDRLLNLSYDNYEIHLNIPYINKKNQSEYIIPEWLNLIDNPKLKIFRTDDYGSITKILPTLMRIDENSEQIIITLDDDLEYMDGFIEYHIEKRKLYPDSAVGFAGITAVDGSCHFCTTVKKDVRVKILEGYKTVSYKRNFFKNDFFQEFVGQSWSDDVIISAYLGKHNIHKMVVNYTGDTVFNPIVESFPVVGHLPNEYGGCYWFRSEQMSDNADTYYKLGYLER
jgi:hypothetical protein